MFQFNIHLHHFLKIWGWQDIWINVHLFDQQYIKTVKLWNIKTISNKGLFF